MKKSPVRLFVVLGAAAFAVFGVMVALSLVGGGGNAQETFVDVPQNGTTLGQEDAPVTIQLYEDFQCPFCARFSRQTLPEVVDSLVRPGKAKVVAETLAFLGPDSVTAGSAALAAAGQDRYWQYADLFFENQGTENSGYVTDGFLTGLAQQTEGLNVDAWNRARDDASVERELAAVAGRANRDGVNSTPTLVIAGPGGKQTVRGAVPAAEVERAVKEVSSS